MEKYNNYMMNAVIVCVIILMMNACTLFGQRDNNLMEVTVSLSVPEEDLEQYDTVVSHNNLQSLTKSNDIVECLSILNDVKQDTISKYLNDYITAYIETFQLCGYEFVEGEDIVYKTVYFNKYGYVVPYECAIAQLKGNNTNIIILRDDWDQRVYHHEIDED